MDHIDIKLTGLSVMLGIPGGKPPEWETALALGLTMRECAKIGIDLRPNIVKNCSIVTKARDTIVADFLDSDCGRLFWIDADMNWTPDQFVRLLAISSLADVVAAAYTMKKDPPQFVLKTDLTNIQQDRYGLWPVEGLGLGFCVCTRLAIETLAATKPTYHCEMSNRQMHAVFRTDIVDGNFRGEDIAFFADLVELGFRPRLDPTIDLGHFGTKEFTGSIRSAFQPK